MSDPHPPTRARAVALEVIKECELQGIKLAELLAAAGIPLNQWIPIAAGDVPMNVDQYMRISDLLGLRLTALMDYVGDRRLGRELDPLLSMEQRVSNNGFRNSLEASRAARKLREREASERALAEVRARRAALEAERQAERDEWNRQYELRKEKERQEKEDARAKWLKSVGGDEKVYEERRDAGLPTYVLNRTKWEKRARALAGTDVASHDLITALLERADPWGVVTIDRAAIRARFVPSGTPWEGDIDTVTGEVVRSTGMTPTHDRWASAVTGHPVSLMHRAFNRLERFIDIYLIPGDPLNNKIVLKTPG